MVKLDGPQKGGPPAHKVRSSAEQKWSLAGKFLFGTTQVKPKGLRVLIRGNEQIERARE